MRKSHPVKASDAVSQVRSVGETSRKLAIADRLEVLAIELRSLTEEEEQIFPTHETFVNLARTIYHGRRGVDEVFGIPGLAVSPGWDILLDLFIAKSNDRTISVSSACIGAACPATTALRWIVTLEKAGLIQRQNDPSDKRRSILVLSYHAITKIEQALQIHL